MIEQFMFRLCMLIEDIINLYQSNIVFKMIIVVVEKFEMVNIK